LVQPEVDNTVTVRVDNAFDQQLDGTVDAAIVRPIAGTAPRQHMLIKGVVDADRNGVIDFRLDQRCDVQSESSVALPQVLACELPVNPDASGVENGFEFDAHR
jgi:hypothetical protein